MPEIQANFIEEWMMIFLHFSVASIDENSYSTTFILDCYIL